MSNVDQSTCSKDNEKKKPKTTGVDKIIKKNKNPQKRNRGRFISAMLFIMGGICIIGFSVYFNAHSSYHSFLYEIGIHLMSHIGIGFFIIGVLVIIFEISHWTAYFRERLSEIVMDKTYLNGLSPEELSEHQTAILRAYYKNNELGGDSSFLLYYKKNIQKYIDMPYRENVSITLSIKEKGEDLEIDEIMRWKCRAHNNKIEPEVRWVPGKDEILTLRDESVVIQHESFKTEANSQGIKELNSTNCQLWTNQSPFGFVVKFTEEINLDSLNVEVKVKYSVPKNRFISWRMAYISKGASMTVVHPVNLRVVCETYYLEDHFKESYCGNQCYEWKTDEWIMPDEGIAIQLLDEATFTKLKNAKK